MSSTAANNAAAMAAAVKAGSGSPMEAVFPHRRTSKAGLTFRGPSIHNYPSMPGSLPNNDVGFGAVSYNSPGFKAGSVLTDGPPLSSIPDNEKGNSKNRIRRASEGSRLSKDKKSAPGDLRCETCGKGYKHSSCLTKHLLVSLRLPSRTPSHIRVRIPLSAYDGFIPVA